jgi:hypothetical protein
LRVIGGLQINGTAFLPHDWAIGQHGRSLAIVRTPDAQLEGAA